MRIFIYTVWVGVEYVREPQVLTERIATSWVGVTLVDHQAPHSPTFPSIQHMDNELFGGIFPWVGKSSMTRKMMLMPTMTLND